MRDEDDIQLVLENFLSEIDQISWLENLGQSSSEDARVIRIHSFSEWKGPEGYGAYIQAEHIRSWKQSLFDDAQEAEVNLELEIHWEHLQALVFEMAHDKVAYNPNHDLWIGPNAAVWFVAELAALVGCNLIRYGTLPTTSASSQWNLFEMWYWVRKGHWPCSYHWADSYWQKLPHRESEFENAFQSGLDDALQCDCPQKLVVL